MRREERKDEVDRGDWCWERKGSPTCNIARHAPRVAGCVSPGIHIGLTPVTKRVENGPVHAEKSVAHGLIALRRRRFRPVVPGRGSVCKSRAGAVWVGTTVGAVGYAGGVLVGLIGRDTAVVVLEV